MREKRVKRAGKARTEQSAAHAAKTASARAQSGVGQLHISDQAQRTEYIDSCLQRMYEGAREIEDLKVEYNEVTGQIHDMDELDALPAEERKKVRINAKRIYDCERKQEEAAGRKTRMSEQDYARMERLEGEYADAVRKFRETEEYHRKIKSDLRRLANEREAFYIREDDLERTLSGTHDLSIICMVALIAILVVLFILQMIFHLKVVYGYMAAVLIAAVAIVALYVRNSNAAKELKGVEATINRLILLQNTVKIRFVNNRNLLDYYAMKYGVEKSSELKTLAKRYEAEKKERQKLSDTQRALAKAERDLERLLKNYHLRYPQKWLHMPDVILSKEEAELYRRELMSRRKQLRARMDYNQDRVITRAKDEIKRLANKYPRYAEEISEQVDAFITEKGMNV